jgi:uncharacterized protein YlbG (UPF0298 family)
LNKNKNYVPIFVNTHQLNNTVLKGAMQGFKSLQVFNISHHTFIKEEVDGPEYEASKF